MKLIYAIVRDEDGSRVMEKLNKNGYSVTKMASTGGFLRSGNTTLMIGTDEEKVDQVIQIIQDQCGPRKQIVVNPVPIMGAGNNYTSYPTSVDVGGATIFVIDVERFEKI
ncbi:MAG: cyclic-di-AMP receptor [Lachnospiraceae bacterium]|nr:cyclic-di-AMP receptor [Lachnospiraceae bacterium]